MARAPAEPIAFVEETTTAIVPRLMRKRQIVDLLQISPRQFDQLVHDGKFPKPLKIGSCSCWQAGDYAAYVAKLRAEANKPARRRA